MMLQANGYASLLHSQVKGHTNRCFLFRDRIQLAQTLVGLRIFYSTIISYTLVDPL